MQQACWQPINCTKRLTHARDVGVQCAATGMSFMRYVKCATSTHRVTGHAVQQCNEQSS